MAEDVKINISVNMQTDDINKEVKEVNAAISEIAKNAERASEAIAKAQKQTEAERIASARNAADAEIAAQNNASKEQIAALERQSREQQALLDRQSREKIAELNRATVLTMEHMRLEEAARREAEKAKAQAAKDAAKAAKEAAKEEERAAKETAKEEERVAKETAKAKEKADRDAAKVAKETAKAEEKAAKDAAKAEEKAAKDAANAEKKAAEERKKATQDVYKNTTSLANNTVSTTQSAFSRIRDIALGTLTALGLDRIFGDVSENLNTALSDASSIVESENLLRATFNQGADSMLAWADASATAYGLTNIEAKKYLSFITGVLNNTGVANDALEDMTTNYVRVVGDLASAFNTETSEAFEAVRSGIAGNTTAMQRYGVVLSVANLQQFLNEKGIAATYKTLDAASKQYVRYAYIMQSTADIQGDYTNTFTSFANTLKTLQGEWQNFLALVGQYAIPMVQPLINALSTVLAYAQAVINYLAELFGWEKYTSDAIDYSYLMKENTEDTADAQEDVTKAVKATNKEMKKGVKLLDLYTLDFTSASKTGTAGTGATTPAQDVKGLLEGIEYNIPDKILPEVDIDMGKVEEIGKAIAGAFDFLKTLWSAVIEPFIITPVLNWLKDDLPTKIAKAFSLAVPLITFKAFGVKGLKALFGKLPAAVTTVFKGVGGVALAAIGTWSLGTAIADSLQSGTPDVLALASGFSSLAIGIGLVATAFGGWAALAVGIVAGFALPFIVANEQIDDVVASVTSGTQTMEGFLSNTSEFVFIDNLTASVSEASDSLDGMYTSVGDANTALANFDTDASTEELESLRTSCEAAISNMESVHDQAAISLSTSFADSIAETGTVADSAVESLRKYSEEQYNLAFQDQETAQKVYAGLRLRELGGEQLTEEEKTRLSTLEALVNKVDNVDTTVSAIDFSDLDLTSLDEAAEYVNKETEKYTSAIADLKKTQSDIISFAEASKGSGLHTDEYYDAQIKAAQAQIDLLDAQSGTFKTKLVNKLNEYYADAFTELSENRMPEIVRGFQTNIMSAGTEWDWLKGVFSNVNLKDLMAEQALPVNDDPDFMAKLAKSIVGPSDTLASFLSKYLDIALSEAQKMVEEGTADEEVVRYAFRYAAITGEFPLKSAIVDENGNDITDDVSKHLEDTLPALFEKIGPGSKDVIRDLMTKTADETGFGIESYEKDGLTFYRFVNNIDFSTLIATDENADDILNAAVDSYKEASNTFKRVSSKEVTPDFVKPYIEEFSKEVKSDENTAEQTQAISEGLTEAISNTGTPAEAKKKGTDLANAITGGITDGFNTSLATGSDFMTAVTNLKNTLSDITTDFETAFKNSLNSIATYINTLADGIKNQARNLNLTDGELTVSKLITSLSSSNFHIPALANGGVIPPGNPFLAVLGDQRSGTNVEAPVTVIKDAVRDVITDTGTDTPVEVHVYIGDREIRDFVIDTVTANNLIVG